MAAYLSATITERERHKLELSSQQAKHLSDLKSYPSNKMAFKLNSIHDTEKDVYEISPEGCAGVVNLGNLQLLIRPRLSFDFSETNEKLLNLMAFANDWPKLEATNYSHLGFTNNLFDWIVNVFHYEVKKVIRKGLWRTFKTFPLESRFIRGRLNVEKQIVLNLRKPAIFSCNPIEHTAAVPENLILQSALGFAGRNCRSMTLRSRSRALAREFEAATQIFSPQVDPQQILPDALNRLNTYYRTALILALLVLRKVGPTHIVGEVPFFSFLIDMWHLFEMFIYKWLKRRFVETIYNRPMKMTVTSEGTPLPATFKPDDIIYKDGQPRLVVETKYTSSTVGGRFNMSHIYQVATYCSYLKCNGVIVYPPASQSLKDLQIIHLPQNYKIFVSEVPWDRLTDKNSIESRNLERWFCELVNRKA